MAAAYVDDEPASQAAFRDGWFYSGDWGALIQPRLLRLAGRSDDLVNIGGIKLPAAQLEARVRELCPGSDCAVLAVNLDAGAIELGVAVTGDPAVPTAALTARLERELIAGRAVGVRLIFVAALPRMTNGKLDRVGLQRLLIGLSPNGTR
jgi:acyl-coenzyme A synthetase/AMP-(fatty) acid ligase